MRRDAWGLRPGTHRTAALYGAYAWIAVTAVRRVITLGQNDHVYRAVSPGTGAVSAMLAAVGGMYEDNLYLSTLYEYLETNVPQPAAPRCAVRIRRMACASRM